MNEPGKKTEHQSKMDNQAEDAVRKYPKAFRIQRLAAHLIDNLVLGFALLPLYMSLGLDSYFESGELLPQTLIIQLHIGMFIGFVLINGWLIYRYGQTVGKRILKIAIATENFQVPEFNRVILIRHLPFAITSAVPGLILINIVDCLMIFRDDRRCLHDIIAGTQVIDVSHAG